MLGVHDITCDETEGALAPSCSLDEQVVTREEIIALIKERGGRCEFPGCCSANCLQRHHIKEKSRGVDNSKKNSIILCSAHHKYAHSNRRQFWECYEKYSHIIEERKRRKIFKRDGV